MKAKRWQSCPVTQRARCPRQAAHSHITAQKRQQRWKMNMFVYFSKHFVSCLNMLLSNSQIEFGCQVPTSLSDMAKIPARMMLITATINSQPHMFLLRDYNKSRTKICNYSSSTFKKNIFQTFKNQSRHNFIQRNYFSNVTPMVPADMWDISRVSFIAS